MKKILTLFTALILFGSMTVVQATDYTVAGEPAAVFGTNWTPSLTDNDMTLEDGVYRFEKSGVSFESDTEIKFKVCADHGWDVAYPGDNYVQEISAGTHDIAITFHEASQTVVLFVDGYAYSVKMHGDFGGSSWDDYAFDDEANGTASLTMNNLAADTYHFGMRVRWGDNWTSNGASFARADDGVAKQITAGSGNCSLVADYAGDYTFVWNYATSTLTVNYPPLPAKSVDFSGLASQVLKGTEVTFAATSTGVNNVGYRFYVKPAAGEYGDAVSSYTFNTAGEYVVKVDALENNAGEPVVSNTANVSVYENYTFTEGTTIYVDFSAMTEGVKGVNYPKSDGNNAFDNNLSYDAEGAGTVKTVVFTTDVEWSTLQNFIKTEKAGWAGLKFVVPGAGKNCVEVAADGASYSWTTITPPTPTVAAKGDWDDWTDELAFTLDEGGLSASATKNLAAGNYAFKLIVGGDYRSNHHTYHRGYTGAANITGNEADMVLQTDAEGDYIFTWTFATNAIQIIFPAEPVVIETAEVKFFPPRTEEHQWEHVYAYQWKLVGMDVIPVSAAWPGDEITSSKEGVWYKCTVDKGTHIIFSDGAGMQTYNIENVQADVCYVANRIDEPANPEDPIKVAFDATCTVDYYITGDENIAGAGNAWNAQVAALKLDENNEKALHLEAGIYEFKLTNGSWAWSLGGQEHLNSACSSAAVTSGNGNVKFKIESAQDVTISYDPATQKICLDAETVLPFENVRTGLTAGNYYTVCFNREMKQIRGASLWSFIGRDASFAYIEQESAPFTAGKPFIVYAESDKLEAVLDGDAIDKTAIVANGALHGTFEKMYQADLNAAGDNIYLVIGNELRRVDGQTGNTLPAYRAYVDLDEIDMISTPSPAPGKKVRSMPMQKDAAQGFENIQASDKPVKVVIDGALYILRGENVYDATGQMVK